MDQTNENKLYQIKNCLNKKDNLFYIHKKNSKIFEKESKQEGKGVLAIMTYGDHIVYLKADFSILEQIPLSQFNYTSGTFEKKWGPEHKTIVLTPNHSSIRKVEIEIKGIDIRKMRLLADKTGDVIEDKAIIKITRHYRFHEGKSENINDSDIASPGKTKAIK